MLPVLVAVLVAAAPPADVVYTVDGGRINGTVVEESVALGVSIQTPDGSVRRIDRNQVSRIEYADGTVSTPHPPAPQAAPPAAAPRPRPEGAQDTIYFLGGGRVRGVVLEENPKTGVRVRLLDGTIQTYPRDDLVRIEYADGSASSRVMTPAAPPHAYPPAPPAPPPPPERRDPLPVYFAVGVGATFLDGDASRNVPMSSVFSSTQAHISGETGLRLSPAFALGLYADAGGVDPSGVIRDQCRAVGNDCIATAARVGILVRHTWEPLSRRPVWLSLGTGWELGQITIDHHNIGSSHDDLLTYTGREYLRVGAGVDFRPNHVLGFGLYGSFGFGAYDTVKDPIQSVSLDRSNHTTAQVGIRLILFP
jgi:hypothetical protein